MTAQMLGKASISFYPIGDKVLVMINDSKSHNSINPIAKAHAWTLSTFSKEFDSRKDYSDFGNYSRSSKKFIEPLSTTRQTYLLVIPNNQLKKYK